MPTEGDYFVLTAEQIRDMGDPELLRVAGRLGVPVEDDWARTRIITALCARASARERGE